MHYYSVLNSQMKEEYCLWNTKTTLKPSRTQDDWVEIHELLFYKNTKIATSCWTTIYRRRCWNPPKKISHVQGQRRSHKTVGRVQLHLKSNLMPARDAATTDWFKIGKKYIKALYRHPTYLAYVQHASYEVPSWMKLKLESRLLGEISINSDMQMTPP